MSYQQQWSLTLLAACAGTGAILGATWAAIRRG